MSERAARLHAADWQGVIHITGGGTGLLTELLAVPGASRTLLDAHIPYSTAALGELLGRQPEQACSAQTARALAMAAMQRAIRLGSPTPFGLSCTASIATDRKKKGTHRAHAAVQTLDVTAGAYWELPGNDRAEQERLITDRLWQLLFETLQLDFRQAETPHERGPAEPEWRRLIEGSLDAHPSSAHDGLLLLPGAFNPLHTGHKKMLAIAEARTGLRGAYELSLLNVDKPPLDYLTIRERLDQFDRPVWLTRLPTFAAKAARFPGAHFVVGVDTLVRIIDPHYYTSERIMTEALSSFISRDTHFVVFGRQVAAGFVVLSDIAQDLPESLRSRCIEIGQTEFHDTVSSTQLRSGAERQSGL
ncbi:MAG: hypothetical protein R3E82_14285 [Pseudomonadales bacterium]